MITTITGTIAALGPSKSTKDGTVYDYIRIAKTNGEDELLKSVSTHSVVNSYIRLGLSGTFFLRNNGVHLLLAAEVDGRFASDYEEFHTEYRAAKIVVKGVFLAAPILIAIGALLGKGEGGGVALMGVLLLIPSWILGFVRALPNMLQSRVPTLQELEAARAAAKTALPDKTALPAPMPA
ncbi:hypothetical protein [Azospirillum sp.]|uniref:hypothetical protein n=1 Tax=Azospirillum sp. TaxID=34012 RepID=UPI003D70C41C